MRVLPKKHLGQNFLVDTEVIDRIIQSIHPLPDQHLIEIGPGLGALTKPLVAKGLTLEVIEVDRDLTAALKALQESYPKLHLHFHTVYQHKVLTR